MKQTLPFPGARESSAAFQYFQVVAVQLLLSLAALLSLHHTFCRRKEEWGVSGSTTKIPWPCELVLCPRLWLKGGFPAGAFLSWSAAFNLPWGQLLSVMSFRRAGQNAGGKGPYLKNSPPMGQSSQRCASGRTVLDMQSRREGN